MTQNAVNNQASDLTIDPLSAADSYLQFDESTVGKWITGNDATDDSFRLSVGSALGTTDTFIITSAGERTMPLQPTFLAENSAIASNVTGNGAVYTVLYDTEITDQGSDYATGSGTFTAPITGNYQFNASVFVNNTLASCTFLFVRITTSNRNYVSFIINATAAANSSSELTLIVGSLTDMDASDTASIAIYGTGQAGNNIDVSATTTRSYFSGYLQS